MDSQTNDAERIMAEAGEYVNMRINAFKLDMVENLSVVFCNVFGVVMFIILGGTALLGFTGVLVYLLGMLIGSVLWAVVIASGVLTIAALLLYFNRQRLFADQMVRMFSRMFFPEKTTRHE